MSAVFPVTKAPTSVPAVLDEFKLHGWSNEQKPGKLVAPQYAIYNGMTYVEGKCLNTGALVQAFKNTDPDDERNLRGLGFKHNPDLDMPTISSNPSKREPA